MQRHWLCGQAERALLLHACCTFWHLLTQILLSLCAPIALRLPRKQLAELTPCCLDTPTHRAKLLAAPELFGLPFEAHLCSALVEQQG